VAPFDPGRNALAREAVVVVTMALQLALPGEVVLRPWWLLPLLSAVLILALL